MAKLLTITTKTVVTLPDDVLGAAKTTSDIAVRVQEFLDGMQSAYEGCEVERTFRNGSGPRKAKAGAA